MVWTLNNTELRTHIERGECRIWLIATATHEDVIDLDTEEVVGMVEDGFLPGRPLGMSLETWEHKCHVALIDYLGGRS